MSTTSPRLIARYEFEGGAYVTLVICGDVQTGSALDALEAIIRVKRDEIRNAKDSNPIRLEEAPDAR